VEVAALADAPPDEGGEGGEGEEGSGEAGAGMFGEARFDAEGEACGFGAGVTVGVDCLDFERVLAGGQVAEAGATQCARLDPVCVQAVETVAECQPLARPKARCGVIDLDLAWVAGRDGYGVGGTVRGVGGQPGEPSEQVEAASGQRFDVSGRAGAIVWWGARIEQGHPAGGSEGEATVVQPESGRLAFLSVGFRVQETVVLEAGDAVDTGSAAVEDLGEFVTAHAIHALVVSDPEITLVIVDDAIDEIVRQPVRRV